MATLAKLKEQKRELEEKLNSGDLSVEPALARIDAAIIGRTKKIQHSQRRLAAAKDAVEAGVSEKEARKPKSKSDLKKMAESRRRRVLNHFK